MILLGIEGEQAFVRKQLYDGRYYSHNQYCLCFLFYD